MSWTRLPIRQQPAGTALVPNECDECGAVVMTEDGKHKHEAWHAREGR